MSDVPWREQIKLAMKEAGLTRNGLAAAMKMSRGTLNDMLMPSARRKLTPHRTRLLSLVLPLDGLQLLLDYTEQEYRAAYPISGFLRKAAE